MKNNDKTHQYIDNVLRPSSFNGIIGQEDFKNKLSVAIQAAKQRNDPLCHILINSPSGFGKTTFAKCICSEYGTKLRTVMGPAIKNMADLLSILTKLEPHTFLFLDECHAINSKLQENLYSALEDFKISLRVANKEIVHIKINPFCLIAATTHLGKLSLPFQSRFGILHTLREYSDDEISVILAANIQKMGLDIEGEAECLENIAKRCRGIPRYANRVLARIRDYVQIYNRNCISETCIDDAMELEGIDKEGLTTNDLKYLKTLYSQFAGEPTGLNTVSSAMNENTSTVENVIEPFLIRKNFIVKTKTGRALTINGLEYILK